MRFLLLALLPWAIACEVGARALAAALLLPFEVREELRNARRSR